MKFLPYIFILLIAGCYQSSGSGNDDSDSGTDTTITDSNSDSDSDADTDSDSDTDTDTDADSDTDSDTDADTDTDTAPTNPCELVECSWIMPTCIPADNADGFECICDGLQCENDCCPSGGSCHVETGDCCFPQTCEEMGHSAGIWDNGCGVELDCTDWVFITGGTFGMGNPVQLGYEDEYPEHDVTVPDFYLMRTEVTVAMYEDCVVDGPCSMPGTNDYCSPDDYDYANYGVEGRENHPVNCVDWYQARQFCNWIGGRLPSEAEWEYAAGNGAEETTYPWGEEEATCEFAVMAEVWGEDGCNVEYTWPVCSKTAGNNLLWDLCDMAGNLAERVEDDFHFYGDDVDSDGESDAPPDGSAWVDEIESDWPQKVSKGGSSISYATDIRPENRGYGPPTNRLIGVGFRCNR